MNPNDLNTLRSKATNLLKGKTVRLTQWTSLASFYPNQLSLPLWLCAYLLKGPLAQFKYTNSYNVTHIKITIPWNLESLKQITCPWDLGQNHSCTIRTWIPARSLTRKPGRYNYPTVIGISSSKLYLNHSEHQSRKLNSSLLDTSSSLAVLPQHLD